MKYVFGTQGAKENLKTVGDTHTNLDGFVQTVREYSDSIITDRFRIVKKYREDDDAEGNAYDWYTIADHYRYEDKTGPLAEQVAASTGELENALCEQDEAVDVRLIAIEDAICELDELLNT